jgi:ubiquinone/menaquinone biosynthesis C-methylase UbiE
MPAHDRRFAPEKMAKLESPQRQELQPPAEVRRQLALGPDHVVADLGVGTGFFARPIAEELQRLGGRGRVIGLDVAEPMRAEALRRAQEAGLGSRFDVLAVSGEGDLPLPDDSLDRLISINTVHELDDRPRVWAECARTLRGGGVLLLVDWEEQGPYDRGPPRDHRVPTPRIQTELEAAGFAVERVDLYPGFYGLRAIWS